MPFANFIYRGFNPAPSSFQKHATWRAAMSYVSGSHNMKWGYQAGYMGNRNTTYVGRQISYRFNNGVPNQITEIASPWNVQHNQEVVINVVSYDMVQQMSLSSGEFPRGVDEFTKVEHHLGAT